MTPHPEGPRTHRVEALTTYGLRISHWIRGWELAEGFAHHWYFHYTTRAVWIRARSGLREKEITMGPATLVYPAYDGDIVVPAGASVEEVTAALEARPEWVNAYLSTREPGCNLLA